MQSYRSQCEAILDELTAQLDAANTSCTMARRHMDALTKQLANTSQNKRRKSRKVKARCWRITRGIRRSRARGEREAELAKAAEKVDDSARTFCINQEITSRVLDCPLASYERKDDLAAAIGAFTLPMDIIVDS